MWELILNHVTKRVPDLYGSEIAWWWAQNVVPTSDQWSPR